MADVICPLHLKFVSSLLNTHTLLSCTLPIIMANSAEPFDPNIKDVLPHHKMYSLQIGNERFQISGASLSSDSPSYFTNFFLNGANEHELLKIDRSAEIFKLIQLHLQGYHLELNNAEIFTRLFNDALYYNLPKLLKNLTETHDYYYTLIEGESLKISKKLLNSKGNFPNFFSIANNALYSDTTQIIMHKNWIRPPPQAAPQLQRSSKLLKELILLLQGAEIDIKSKEHRRSLIKEAKYYRFNGIIQKFLIEYQILYDPFTHHEMIIVDLEYLDFKFTTLDNCTFYYQRPYDIDKEPRELIVQVKNSNYDELRLGDKRVVYYNNTRAKMEKFLVNFCHLHGLVFESLDEQELTLGSCTEYNGLCKSALFKLKHVNGIFGAEVLKVDIIEETQEEFKNSLSFV